MRHGISADDATAFFATVQGNAVRAGDAWPHTCPRRSRSYNAMLLRTGGVGELLNEIQFIAVRMWTTAETLAGLEL